MYCNAAVSAAIAHPQVARLVATEAVLAFPTGQVGVDQQIGRGHVACAHADDQHQAGSDPLDPLAEGSHGGRIEELRKP